MKKNIFKISIISISFLAAQNGFTAITWGDNQTDLGALTLSGYARVNYQQKDYHYDSSDEKIKFDVAQLKLNYDSKQLFGQLEYRCYQYDTLCDFSTLVDGYIGYKIADKNTLTVGVQPIPFGPSRFWESSLYGGIDNTVGLEDAHNLGANLHWEFPQTQTKIDAAYFIQDGGHYVGSSKDAARYTANPVSTSNTEYSSLSEKNMWIGRISQEILPLSTDDFHMNVGASYWYSDIDNKSLNTDGHRKAWAGFTTLGYKDLSLSFTGGKTKMGNGDLTHPDVSIFGSYDSEYLVANNANFYTVDLSYKLKNLVDGFSFTPYLMHSSYEKSQSGYKNSQRDILGLSVDYKKISLVSEYIMSKNDPFIGGDISSLAQGDAYKTNKLLNFTLFYYF